MPCFPPRPAPCYAISPLRAPLTEVPQGVPQRGPRVPDPGGVGEVAQGGVDPVALDDAGRLGGRQPGYGGRGRRHVQDCDVTRRVRHCGHRTDAFTENVQGIA